MRYQYYLQAIRQLLQQNLDMLTLISVAEHKKSYRTSHAWGNKILTKLINLFFNTKSSDVLSGYRLFSKAFAKSFPAHSRGFEIEVDLSIYAHQMRLPIGELEVPFRSRPEGSFSKLNTIKDGIIILKTILYLVT